MLKPLVDLPAPKTECLESSRKQLEARYKVTVENGVPVMRKQRDK